MKLVLGTMNFGPQDDIGMSKTRVPEQADVEEILEVFRGVSDEIDTGSDLLILICI